MPQPNDIANEQLSATAFSRQSSVFDSIYGANSIIQYKRDRVRNHVDRYLKPSSHVLELNAGTGEDALYFAQHSHLVHATDISNGMLEVLRGKIAQHGLNKNITTEQCSYTELDRLMKRGPYDHIFSNFAGLNCTEQLSTVLKSFKPLLEPGGIVTLVILPPFCLWETLLVFKGKFKTAFRRFNSTNGATAHVEGVHFKCWYYKPSYIVDVLKADYDVLNVEGLCTIVPPSYIEHFAEKHPRVYSKLMSLENKMKGTWPWKNIGDYYIISLRKR